MSQRKLRLEGVLKELLGDGYVPSEPVGTANGMSVRRTTEMSSSENTWLTPKEAAQQARCGVKTIYREVKAGRLRAARVGGRRELRIKPEWVDAWLERTATPVEAAA